MAGFQMVGEGTGNDVCGGLAYGGRLTHAEVFRGSAIMKEAVAKPPLHVDAFVSNASDKDGFLNIDAIETIASTGFATASKR